MRVISGKARGIPLKSVPADTTRPILDRVKTALFDTLRPHLQDRRVLDLFAGSGAIGIEALSQGAAHCTFIDLEPKAVDTVKENLKATKLSDLGLVRKVDAFSFLRRSTEVFDLIFIAPPQYKNFWLQALQGVGERPDILSPGALVVVQIDPKEYSEIQISCLEEYQQRKYGNTLLLFFRKIAN